MSEIPRRAHIDLCTPAENAIRLAISEVEKVGADPHLTQMVVELDRIRERLADYVDRTVKPETHSCICCPAEVRNLYACAHNAIINYGTERGLKKMVRLREAVGEFEVLMNKHFAESKS